MDINPGIRWRGAGVDGRDILILAEEPARLAHMARYLVRPPVATRRVHAMADGRVLLEIPPDPRTGATSLALDSLEFLRIYLAFWSWVR
jgi:hypothetical protein